MTTGDSPAGARRRLRLALRKAREATGRTQGQVADALDWSISKVNRIESGDVTISSTDLDALLRLLDVRDPEQVGRLAEEARTSRRRGWWDQPRFRENLSPATQQLIQFEMEASAIRVFQFANFPGLLQTREYARSIIGTVGDDMSEEGRSARLEARMLRQENLRSRLNPPQYIVILDELLLLRTIGSQTIMVEQLKLLVEAAGKPENLIRLLPKEESSFLLMGAFNVYDIGAEENAILYREGSVTDELLENADTVHRFRLRFEQMWNLCLSEDASARAIEAHYASARAFLDRER